MIGWLATGVAAYGALITGLYVFQRQLLYQPSRGTPDVREAGVAEMRPVRLATADGLDLLAWWRPPRGTLPAIVYLHGNAGNIGHRGEKVRAYLDAGYGVLLVEWRGYAGNPGRPTEQGLYADGRAALAFLESERVAPSRAVLYGESLGSGVAVRVAAEAREKGVPLAAVVLESPFTSIAAVAQHHYFYVPARFLVEDKFDSASHIANIGAPLFVVHGERDRVVPVRFGRELFDRAKEPKEAVWLKAGDHNDLVGHGLARAVLDFLSRRVS